MSARKLKGVVAVLLFVCLMMPPAYTQRFGGNYDRGRRWQGRQNCATPDNYYGKCVALSYCPQIANLYKQNDPELAQEYVFGLQRSCGTRSINGDPLVCCTRPSNILVTERPHPFYPTEGWVFDNEPTHRNPFLPHSRETPTTTFTTTTTTTTTSTTEAPTPSAAFIEPRGPSCRGPDTKPGECVEIKRCAPLIQQLVVKQNDATFARFLQASNRICGGSGSIVCCPTGQLPVTPGQHIVNRNEIPRRLVTVKEGCGYSLAAYKKIIGGEESKKGAWPWIALLGYNDGSVSPFKCGGTLITARHVLTAAHCILDSLSFVRLGEHDLTTDTESRHIDMPIARHKKHANYNRINGHSDIAMLYLERNVQFTDAIVPICLPMEPKLRQKSYVDSNPIVVGWGKTMEGGKSSNVLQQLQILVYPNKICHDNYQKQHGLRTENQFDSAVLCAGNLDGGMDTCQGDSGGPLMTSENSRFYLIGVVSYGIGCARANIPGVYSSVQYFMDWITEQVQNTP